MIIERKLKFEGSQGEKELTALFDSRATYSCINKDFIAGLEKPVPLNHPIELETAAEKSYLRIHEAMRLDFYLNVSSNSPNARFSFVMLLTVLSSLEVICPREAFSLLNSETCYSHCGQMME